MRDLVIGPLRGVYFGPNSQIMHIEIGVCMDQ